MTDYRAAAADYLATRRAMGYKLAYQGQMLAQFVAYLDAADAEHLTIRHAVDWAKQPSSAARAWWAVRLSTVRAFARYLSALDPATEIPPTGLVPAPSHRVVPYIYTEDDIAHRASRRHLPDVDRARRRHRHEGGRGGPTRPRRCGPRAGAAHHPRQQVRQVPPGPGAPEHR